jgi:hypothetical protein
MYIIMGESSSTLLQTPMKNNMSESTASYFFHDDCYCDPVDSMFFIDRSNLHGNGDQDDAVVHKPCHLAVVDDASSSIATAVTDELSFSEDEVLSKAESDHSMTASVDSISYAPQLYIKEEGQCVEVSLNPHLCSQSQHEEEETYATSTSHSFELDEATLNTSGSVEVTAAWDSYSNLVTYVNPTPQFELKSRQKRLRKGQGRLLCTPEPLVFSQCYREIQPFSRSTRLADI